MLKKFITGLLAAALFASSLALAGCGGNSANNDGSFPISVDGSSQSGEATAENTAEATTEAAPLPESYQIQDVHPILQSELKAGCETYAATMLPVITGITRALGVEPYLLYFGLLTGATLGGNLTPIGASANITATGLLKKEGFSVSFGDFMKIGVPFTLTAVFVGYLFIWIFWA